MCRRVSEVGGVWNGGVVENGHDTILCREVNVVIVHTRREICEVNVL